MSTARKASIRWVLLRSFLLLVVLSSVTILAVVAIRARHAEAVLSERLLLDSAQRAGSDLASFFTPANAHAEIAQSHGHAGMLQLELPPEPRSESATQAALEAARRINQLYVPVMRAHPDITAIQVADDSGRGVIVLREGDDWRNRVVSYDDWGPDALWTTLDVSESVAVTTHRWEVSDYDPRTRSWYAGVLELPPAELFWTDPYTFFTTQAPGITVSSRWDNNGNAGVVMLDVQLREITSFTQNLRPTPRGKVAILSEQGHVLGLPAGATGGLLKPPADVGLPVMAAGAEHAALGDPVKLRVESERWWLYRGDVSLTPRRSMQVLVAIPEADLLAGVREQQLVVLIVAALAIAASFLLALLMARRYSRPLEQLARSSRRIADLDFTEPVTATMPLRELEQLADAQQQSLAALQSFSKYVPMDVVRELVAKGEVARIGGRTAELTVMFTDVVGFTTISETMPAEALTSHMAEYFQAMIECIHKHGGTVDKLVGDAIVAFWGAPRENPDHAKDAVSGVLACRALLAELNVKWSSGGKPPLPTRFGLATGPMVVGNIGAQTRLAYTVLGDTVNLAARLEGMNKQYGTEVIASRPTVDACGSGLVWRRLDRVAVVGKDEPVDTCELLGREGEVPPEKLAAREKYESALEAYQQGDFEKCIRIIDLAAEVLRTDPPSTWLRDAATTLLKSPRQKWDGTTRSIRK
jgi:adenylate cyclase